jgi:hypothetical protein
LGWRQCITTTGRKSGMPRRIETSSHLGGCHLGHACRRAWMANLHADRTFTLHPGQAPSHGRPARDGRIVSDETDDGSRSS